MKQDIETALKMLDARGGELDKIAAEIIRKLRKLPFGQHPAVSDEQWDATIYAGKLAALQVEHRGALLELDEIFGMLGRELREHEGDFADTDTARSLADEAAMMIRDLRGQIMQRGIEASPLVKELKAQLEEKQARIDKLMERQQELMNMVVDAQMQRGVFAPERQDERLMAAVQPVRYDYQPLTGLTYVSTGGTGGGSNVPRGTSSATASYGPGGGGGCANGIFVMTTGAPHRDDLAYDAPNVPQETTGSRKHQG